MKYTMVWLGALFLVGGCISTKSYVDPKERTTEYGQLRRPSVPRRLVLNVEFQVNGTRKERAEAVTRRQIERVLTSSGMFNPVPPETAGVDRMNVVVNNVANVGGAIGSGIGTGLTFGLAGSGVTDGYVISVDYQGAGRFSKVTKEYKHAIYSTIGVKEAPPGIVPMSVSEAYSRVIEDVMLKAMGDLQRDGSIP